MARQIAPPAPVAPPPPEDPFIHAALPSDIDETLQLVPGEDFRKFTTDSMRVIGRAAVQGQEYQVYAHPSPKHAATYPSYHELPTVPHIQRATTHRRTHGRHAVDASRPAAVPYLTVSQIIGSSLGRNTGYKALH